MLTTEAPYTRLWKETLLGQLALGRPYDQAESIADQAVLGYLTRTGTHPLGDHIKGLRVDSVIQVVEASAIVGKGVRICDDSGSRVAMVSSISGPVVGQQKGWMIQLDANDSEWFPADFAHMN